MSKRRIQRRITPCLAYRQVSMYCSNGGDDTEGQARMRSCLSGTLGIPPYYCSALRPLSTIFLGSICTYKPLSMTIRISFIGYIVSMYFDEHQTTLYAGELVWFSYIVGLATQPRLQVYDSNGKEAICHAFQLIREGRCVCTR